MTYSRYQHLKPEDFKRLCGVHHQTFTQHGDSAGRAGRAEEEETWATQLR